MAEEICYWVSNYDPLEHMNRGAVSENTTKSNKENIYQK